MDFCLQLLRRFAYSDKNFSPGHFDLIKTFLDFKVSDCMSGVTDLFERVTSRALSNTKSLRTPRW